MKDLVEPNDQKFSEQLNNFSAKLAHYQVVLNLSNAQLQAVADDAAMMDFCVSAVTTSKSYAKSWISRKDETRKGNDANATDSFPTPVDVSTLPTAVQPGVEKRFREIVRLIKATNGYTPAVGADLGIIAPENTATLGAPQLKIEMKGGQPVISFVKRNSDGIRLYSKRGSESEFTFLAVDTRSPYTDARPNQVPGVSETRQYYAYYIKNDEQVGSQSAVISISLG